MLTSSAACWVCLALTAFAFPPNSILSMDIGLLQEFTLGPELSIDGLHCSWLAQIGLLWLHCTYIQHFRSLLIPLLSISIFDSHWYSTCRRGVSNLWYRNLKGGTDNDDDDDLAAADGAWWRCKGWHCVMRAPAHTETERSEIFNVLAKVWGPDLQHLQTARSRAAQLLSTRTLDAWSCF